MLCSRQKFENMAVRVAKVKPPAAFARSVADSQGSGVRFRTESGFPARAEGSYRTHYR